MKLAYLSLILPTLSETFVYEELHAVQRLGHEVKPFSVHAPKRPPDSQSELASKVEPLYAGGWTGLVGRAARAVPHTRAWSVFGALIADLIEARPWRLRALRLIPQAMAGLHLARRLQETSVQHLHVHFAHAPTQIAMYAALGSGVPYSFMAHANDLFEHGFLLRTKARRAKFVASISQYNQRYLESLGVPASAIRIVRCGVDLHGEMAPRTTSPSDPLLAHPVDSAVPRLGSLGRMVEKKGFNILLDVIAQLRDRGHLFQLDLAGDGPLRAQLEAQAKAKDLQAQVRFLGSMPHVQVAEWMRTLDGFVLACQVDSRGSQDGIPVALMEAMLLGVPVISTKISGIPELIRPGETGWLAQPGDVRSLVDALLTWQADRPRHTSVTRSAQAWVRAEFDRELNAQRLIRCIQS